MQIITVTRAMRKSLSFYGDNDNNSVLAGWKSILGSASLCENTKLGEGDADERIARTHGAEYLIGNNRTHIDTSAGQACALHCPHRLVVAISVSMYCVNGKCFRLVGKMDTNLPTLKPPPVSNRYRHFTQTLPATAAFSQ